MTIRKVFLMLLALLILAVMLGCGATHRPARVETPPSEPETPPTPEEPQLETYFLGDTVAISVWEITVNSARFASSELFSPEPGEEWLAIDITLKNTGVEEEAVSSLMQFELVDQDHYKADLAIWADGRGSLDGSLGAGRTMRGEIAFVILEDHNAWELIFTPEFWDKGQAIFKIERSVVDE